MEEKPAAQVVWLFAKEDESLARELLRLSAVVEGQGLIRNFSELDLKPGQDREAALARRAAGADLVLLLVSPDLLAENSALARASLGVVRQARQNSRGRVFLVLLRATQLPDDLASLQVLPRDGQPIVGRRDRDAALLEVIRNVQELITFRPTGPELEGFSPPAARAFPLDLDDSAFPVREATSFEMPEVPAPAQRRLTVNDIFRLDGPPDITFVEPPQFSVLKLELQTMGTGLLVEGPSKIGKTTAIKKAMAALDVPRARQTWWAGQAPPPVDEFRAALDGLLSGRRPMWLFIDDFHYLEDEAYRRILAFRMKALADQEERYGKVVLIGINPLGSSLAQVMPDLAGRFRILRVDREKDWAQSSKIAELIVQGEGALNAKFLRRDEFVSAAGGSFFVAQLLCNRAAVQAGVFEPSKQPVGIDVGPADVVSAIGAELSARYRAPLLDLASFDASSPPRGAGLSLLWLLSRSDDGAVALKEARLRFPMLGQAFDWLREGNLTRCFQETSSLKGLFYFSRASATLTLEDPQLKFYLRELDWAEFAEASGHGQVLFHPQDGPVWPPTASSAAAGSVAVQGAVDGRVGGAFEGRACRVLHLSDLHFATPDQAIVSYAQLAADLRQQGVDRLDALLVSGDLVNQATPGEYDVAREFLERVIEGFSLARRRVLLVPGNHDVNWTLSKAAYSLHWRSRYKGDLREGAYIAHDAEIIEVRDEGAYSKRLSHFADFYRQVKGEEYPLEYDAQGTIADLSEVGLCVLGLNSAWQTDHHYSGRASIHTGALSRALLRLGPPDGRLRVAMFHHPMHGDEDARIRDAAFLQQLAVNGFRLVLHGHVHRADSTLYRYDRNVGGRTIDVITAGTFGAPVREWVPGYPLQYNLLLVDKARVTVETRCRREVNGAWEADAIWRQGPGKDPLPRYHIDL